MKKNKTQLDIVLRFGCFDAVFWCIMASFGSYVVPMALQRGYTQSVVGIMVSGYLVSAFAGQFFWASICDQPVSYTHLVLPDLPRAPGPKLRQALLATTASVIGTGHTLHEDPQLLEQLFGVRIREKIEPVAASYLLTEPKEVFRSFPARDWVFLHMDSYRLELTDADGYLPLVGARCV